MADEKVLCHTERVVYFLTGNGWNRMLLILRDVLMQSKDKSIISNVHIKYLQVVN